MGNKDKTIVLIHLYLSKLKLEHNTMGNKDKTRKGRSRGPIKSFTKKCFHGNRFTSPSNNYPSVTTTTASSSPASASRENIGECDNEHLLVKDSSTHYIIINSGILSNLFSLVGCCPTCGERDVSFFNDFTKNE